MSKKNKVEGTPFELSELHQLKLENVVLKLNHIKDEMLEMNNKFMALANYRDQLIEEARKELGAPENYLVNSTITHFVEPPPNPATPAGEEDGSGK